MARKGGRPRIIDQQCPGMDDGVTYGDAVLQYVRLGVPLEMAAKAAGIGSTTLFEWKAAGARDDPDPRYKLFLEACERAEAESVVRALASIREAFQGVEERTVRTVRKPVRVRVEVEGQPGQFVDRIEYVEETTLTEGRRIHWQAGAWLAERRATADFGRARVWKDAEPPAGHQPAEVVPGLEGQEAAERQVAAAFEGYLRGREDQRSEDAQIDSAGERS